MQVFHFWKMYQLNEDFGRRKLERARIMLFRFRHVEVSRRMHDFGMTADRSWVTTNPESSKETFCSPLQCTFTTRHLLVWALGTDQMKRFSELFMDEGHCRYSPHVESMNVPESINNALLKRCFSMRQNSVVQSFPHK